MATIIQPLPIKTKCARIAVTRRLFSTLLDFDWRSQKGRISKSDITWRMKMYWYGDIPPSNNLTATSDNEAVKFPRISKVTAKLVGDTFVKGLPSIEVLFF